MDKSLIHEYQDDPVPIREKCVSRHLKTLSSSKSDEDHKAAAIQRLALIGVVGEHQSQILKHIQDPSPKVRSATAIAAKNLDNTAAQALIQRLREESDDGVRLAIIEALASYDSPNTKIAFNAELAKLDLPETHLKIILKYMTHHPNEMHLMPLVSRFELFPEDQDVLLAISTIANRDFCSAIKKQEKPVVPEETVSCQPVQAVSERQSATVEHSEDSEHSKTTEQLASVEPEQVASVEPEQVASMESEQVASMESEQVASMESEQVASVEPSVQVDSQKESPDIMIPDNPCLNEIRKWVEKNQKKSRNQWLLDGFKAAGFPVFAIDIPDVPFILDAIDGPRPISINAQLALKKLSKLTQDSLEWPVEDARWHYTRYFKSRAKKFNLDLSDRNEKGIKK